jgi:hypothetical protein
VWSGWLPPQITRNATSWLHNRSIRRELRIPCPYAHTSRVTIMSGSWPARPAPPVRRLAWNAVVSRCLDTTSITSHT